MPRKKKTEEAIVVENVAKEEPSGSIMIVDDKEPTILRGKDALKDICLAVGVPLGKRKQTHGVLTNPRSKHFNSKIAKNRKKEKARRKHNAKMRAHGGK